MYKWLDEEQTVLQVKVSDGHFRIVEKDHLDWQVLSSRSDIEPADEPDPTALATAARIQRNGLLAASDWTQVADAPVDKAAWATYRQALRDITAQAGFPETIDWPAIP